MPLPSPLPLFPLQAVLFPGGALGLKVFEARYLDLITRCLREQQPFGVVCLTQGREVRQGADDGPTRFEALGTLAHLVEVDAEQSGLLRIRCSGGQRFRFERAVTLPQGLWAAEDVTVLDADPSQAPSAELAPAAQALARALPAIRGRDPHWLSGEPRLDDAGWVANRWCELLPISLQARQRLLALDDPLARLQVVHAFLAQQQLL
mgnify:FL=1